MAAMRTPFILTPLLSSRVAGAAKCHHGKIRGHNRKEGQRRAIAAKNEKSILIRITQPKPSANGEGLRRPCWVLLFVIYCVFTVWVWMISMACSQTRIFRIFCIIRGSTDCEISPETCCHVSGCQVRQDGDQQPGAGLTLSGSLCTFSMYDSKVLQGWRLLSLWFWILLNELNK